MAILDSHFVINAAAILTEQQTKFATNKMKLVFVRKMYTDKSVVSVSMAHIIYKAPIQRDVRNVSALAKQHAVIVLFYDH